MKPPTHLTRKIRSLDENGKNTYPTARISSKGFETLEEYIHNSKANGLSHIVLSENNRSPFLDDIFINYENYSYLKKTFDSSNHNFENKIIILKIDYSIFDKQI